MSARGLSTQPTERVPEPGFSTDVTVTEDATALQEETTVLSLGPPHSTRTYGGQIARNPASASYRSGGGCMDGIWTVPPRGQTLYVPSGSEMVFRLGGQTPLNKVSASATELLGRVDTNGGGVGRERSLKAGGSGMERIISADLPPDGYLVDVYIRAPQGDAPYVFRVVVQ